MTGPSSTAAPWTQRERWRRAGLETYDEMQTNCCFAIQDKTWVNDPDGNAWEVFVVLEDNLAESPACCASTDASVSTCATSEPVTLTKAQ